jgi:hypothetical protein
VLHCTRLGRRAGDRGATLAAAIVDRRIAVDAVWPRWLAHIGAIEATRR